MTPDWFKRVRVGDVLLFGLRRTPRVIRSVSTNDQGEVWCVEFTIMHCSWTRRCYTTYFWSDLKQMGCQPSGVRSRLRTKLDRRIAENLKKENSLKQTLTCCDVHGVL